MRWQLRCFAQPPRIGASRQHRRVSPRFSRSCSMTNSTDIAVIDLYPASLPSSGRAPVVVVSIGIDVGQATPTAPMPPTDKLEALTGERARMVHAPSRETPTHLHCASIAGAHHREPPLTAVRLTG